MRITYVAVAAVALAASAFGQNDWPTFGHDPAGTRYSTLKQIDAKNVTKLVRAWTYHMTVEGAPVPAAPAAGDSAVGDAPGGRGRGGRAGRGGGGGGRNSEVVPLVINGVMYITTGYGRVVALEPETGKKIWEYESDSTPSTRGISYWGGDKTLPPQIVVGTMNGWLFTLNAKTGKLTTSFGDNGKVNLKTGIADHFPKGPVLMSTPAAIYKNLIFTGAQLQEEPANGPSGDVRAWDVHTGKLVWTFHTIPRPGEANTSPINNRFVKRTGTAF